MKKTVLTILFAFCITVVATAQTEYHVSATSGSDANKGLKEKPFKTISAAAKVAKPGDVITVHAGTYRESIEPETGGTSETKRITYQAAKGEKVIVKGSEVVKKWTKLENDTWKAVVPNTFFGNHNPFNIQIKGDWFWPKKGRIDHTGCVYLNGKWLMEAEKKEEVLTKAKTNDPLWFAEVDNQNTIIYAQFIGVDPNKELIEVNARETIFYPKKAFVNYITVKGFTMCHAATNWAPPTDGQKGLIGTNWSKGWIIENNDISYSKCSGVALGKYSDEWDKEEGTTESYYGTINRALANKWNKDNIGSHIVRNNTIAFCEQTGIVGSMGCSFSTITGNIIHDINIIRLFDGAEQAGIKFHGAIDVQIIGNQIYRADRGIWLDWMAQGAVVANNLMYENTRQDLFLEVDHGPMTMYNNIFLSKENVLMNSSGAAFAHNLFGGKFNVIQGEQRKTPYHKSHSTEIVDIVDNRSGDVRFVNNLFVNGGSSKGYDKAELEMVFKGNVYLKDSEMSVFDKDNILKPDFDANVKLLTEKNGMYLEINLDKSLATEGKRTLVSTDNLGKAFVPNLPFENANGTKLIINKDYNGAKRLETNSSPGPFEIKNNGIQKIKVW
ncbi:DUF1565 domain-containing protein [Flavobacterium gilvum]|uniref:Right handed beta helix domain-containing protein n=1 Tax=Flavobacterium gilvum TaxID=1492737 RepID=A0AAC9I655_9FLAO|nr:right-handed parallel beta-helix repeat-containing protein [Flavobacterium gilvum]AOW10790.1 hypothetical protein EM308_15550 [Flavobacterium gilvum]KFC59942.1 hypothetical protein FEM08_12460 [Flavobacterium gilvum]